MENGIYNNLSGAEMRSGTKIWDVKEQNLEVGDSVFKINDLIDVSAKDQRKELLDFLIQENPDSKISDELELYVLKSLMKNEYRIKMPDSEQLGEEGFSFPDDIVGFKIVNSCEGEDHSSIGVLYQRRENNIEKDTHTVLRDDDNDGYADALDMYAYDDETPKKSIYIDLDNYRGYSKIEDDKEGFQSFRASK